MGKKNEKHKKEIEKLLSGVEREVMSIQILIGNGGITGGFRYDRKIDEKFTEIFGEKYLELVEEFKKIASEPTKKIGKKLSKLIIEEALEGKMAEATNKDEISELLVKLGELLGAEIKKENIEAVEVKECDEDDDE